MTSGDRPLRPGGHPEVFCWESSVRELVGPWGEPIPGPHQHRRPDVYYFGLSREASDVERLWTHDSARPELEDLEARLAGHSRPALATLASVAAGSTFVGSIDSVLQMVGVAVPAREVLDRIVAWSVGAIPEPELLRTAESDYCSPSAETQGSDRQPPRLLLAIGSNAGV